MWEKKHLCHNMLWHTSNTLYTSATLTRNSS
jgi:hypothetical protein